MTTTEEIGKWEKIPDVKNDDLYPWCSHPTCRHTAMWRRWIGEKLAENACWEHYPEKEKWLDRGNDGEEIHRLKYDLKELIKKANELCKKGYKVEFDIIQSQHNSVHGHHPIIFADVKITKEY